MSEGKELLRELWEKFFAISPATQKQVLSLIRKNAEESEDEQTKRFWTDFHDCLKAEIETGGER